MPRFTKDGAFGYDLEQELPFVEIRGRRAQLGSAGGLILACPVCAREQFREVSNYTSHPEWHTCFDGHGQMEPIYLDEISRWRHLWTSLGGALVSVQERREKRLNSEAEPNYIKTKFGKKTENDFPSGHVCDCDNR